MHILLSHFSLYYALNNDTEYANALNNSAEPCLDLHAWFGVICLSFVPVLFFLLFTFSLVLILLPVEAL